MSVQLLVPGTTSTTHRRVMSVVVMHDFRSFVVKGSLDDGSLPKLERVFECAVDASADVRDVLDTCFEEFNVGEDSDAAQQYRELGLRSLSVGDVVVVGDVAYRCDSFGWTEFPLYTEPTT